MNRDGMKKAFLQRELKRLERVKSPIQDELKSVQDKIKEVKKQLRRLKNVKAVESNFLF